MTDERSLWGLPKCFDLTLSEKAWVRTDLILRDMVLGVPPVGGRAGRASHEARSGLHHSATIHNAKKETGE